MKQELILFLIILFLGFSVASMIAQQTIAASGVNPTVNEGSISYTVGQITYRTLSGSPGSITQGVQQPYEISTVTTVENTEGISLKFDVYPNPTNGLITLTMQLFKYKNVKYQLYDMNGILLLGKNIYSEETEIPLT